jgi:transposase-like protein
MTGDVEEEVLEMYLSGISVRKIAGVKAPPSSIAYSPSGLACS